jgi:hypothetical protein
MKNTTTMPRTTGVGKKRIKHGPNGPSAKRARQIKRAPGKQGVTSGAETNLPEEEVGKSTSLLASSVDDISPELKVAIYERSVEYGQELAHQEVVDGQQQDLQAPQEAALPLESDLQEPQETALPPLESDILSFNNATVEFDFLEAFAINEDAFGYTNANNQPRTKVAERQAKSRATLKIVRAILSIGEMGQQALALRQALCHPEIRVVAKAAGFQDNFAAHFQNEQAKKMIRRALETNSNKGHCNDDKASFVDSVIMSIADSPDNGVDKKKISQARMAKSLGLNPSRAKRLFVNGRKKAQGSHTKSMSRFLVTEA